MMVSKQVPTVLHIDDMPGELRTWVDQVNEDGRVRISVKHPDDVTQADITNTSLVLVDFRLDSWPQRDAVPVLALRPRNGLALLSVLQEAMVDNRPRAFALYTAALHDLAKGLTPQPHIVARAHNLEWIFEKNDRAEQRRQYVADLAVAVEDLPQPWPNEAEFAVAALKKWLRLDPARSWADGAWRSVLHCRPPIHDFAQSTRGLGVLRWMLHRILPYPTFLYDDARLAARLRVDLASWRQSLNTCTEIQSVFAPALYQGNLANIAGRRWWRSGVESIIFDLASDDPADLTLLHQRLRLHDSSLMFLSSSVVFPVLGPGYGGKDFLAEPGDVVEVVPDDWPPYADTAWALKADLAEHPELMTIVAVSEQEHD